MRRFSEYIFALLRPILNFTLYPCEIFCEILKRNNQSLQPHVSLKVTQKMVIRQTHCFFNIKSQKFLGNKYF